MRSDNPEYYSTLCPVDVLGCPRAATPEAVIDHLVADHDARLVATVLVREAYMYQRLSSVLDTLGAAIEREIDALIPDPLASDDFIEVEFRNER